MHIIRNAFLAMILLAQAIGIFFLLAGVFYLFKYFIDTQSPGRNEYIFGVVIGLAYGTSICLFSLLGAKFLRDRYGLRDTLFRRLLWPGMAGVVLLLSLFILSIFGLIH